MGILRPYRHRPLYPAAQTAQPPAALFGRRLSMAAGSLYPLHAILPGDDDIQRHHRLQHRKSAHHKFGVRARAHRRGYSILLVFSTPKAEDMRNLALYLVITLLAPGFVSARQADPHSGLARRNARPAAPDSFYLLRPDKVFDGEQMHEGWQVLVHGHLIESAGAAGTIKAPAGTVI